MSKSAAVPQLHRVQALVDDLASSLRRSIEVSTPSLNVICASAQFGAIDARRVDAILNRAPSLEPVPWMLTFGIQDATAPVRIPANPTYDMLARVCFPLRHDDRLVGYMWLIDSPPLASEELSAAALVMGDLAALIAQRDQPLAAIVAARRDLAQSIADGIDGALARAQRADALPTDGVLTVHRLLIDAPPGSRDPWLNALNRPLRRRPFLVLDAHDSLTVFESPRAPADTDDVLDEVTAAALSVGIRIVARGTARVSPIATPQACVVRARFMADIAQLTGEPSQDWSTAGAWRMLQGWDLSLATVYSISPEAADLVGVGNDTYWRTALAYLASGRDTSATAAKLFIHRATLHYRLDKVRSIVGDSAFDDGSTAACLLVALQLYDALHSVPAPRAGS